MKLAAIQTGSHWFGKKSILECEAGSCPNWSSLVWKKSILNGVSVGLNKEIKKQRKKQRKKETKTLDEI